MQDDAGAAVTLCNLQPSVVVEGNALLTSEAPLTGESTPVGKSALAVTASAPLAERHDSVFIGIDCLAPSLSQLECDAQRSLDFDHLGDYQRVDFALQSR